MIKYAKACKPYLLIHFTKRQTMQIDTVTFNIKQLQSFYLK